MRLVNALLDNERNVRHILQWNHILLRRKALFLIENILIYSCEICFKCFGQVMIQEFNRLGIFNTFDKIVWN